MQQEYPDLTKSYTPTCTVLHRCAEDTGCCERNTKCQYKSRERVHLYFYVSSFCFPIILEKTRKRLPATAIYSAIFQ